jgi:hypothetical protein
MSRTRRRAGSGGGSRQRIHRDGGESGARKIPRPDRVRLRRYEASAADAQEQCRESQIEGDTESPQPPEDHEGQVS